MTCEWVPVIEVYYLNETVCFHVSSLPLILGSAFESNTFHGVVKLVNIISECRKIRGFLLQKGKMVENFTKLNIRKNR